MKISTFIVATLCVVSTGCHAERRYSDYDVFYAGQPGALFKTPVNQDRSAVYANSGGGGIYTDVQATIGGKPVKIQVGSNYLSINRKRYRFAQAAIFPGEHVTELYPNAADIFIAQRAGNVPPLLCLEGHGNGSGEADRYQQVYLLVDPLGRKGRKPEFLHLPSLLSSCRAVLKTADDRIAFPKNDYLVDERQGTRVGLLVSYFTYEHGSFMPTNDTIRLRFVSPDNPFQFSRQDE
ncbi:hypothetical protein [Paraburkholderia sp. J12]|uniref:hypothetical protein n=1 Tax=Paraburkholderia sp. J12 TaxID=2805432 RepID=UPI002ABE9615|nr:hypothetical protein [Paraburkholderia sp. J12]